MTTRRQRHRLKTENAKRPAELLPVPRDSWPDDGCSNRTDVWLSRNYLVQGFIDNKAIRLSVNRTEMRADGRWSDEITWDELQAIKRAVGFGDRFAVEIFPKDIDIVNVANMRHLWIPTDDLPIGWKNEK